MKEKENRKYENGRGENKDRRTVRKTKTKNEMSEL